jgi:flagellar protein FlbD
MIRVTRFSGQQYLINADQIETIESAPDTIITLLSGRKHIVRENTDELLNRILAYRKGVLAGVIVSRKET